jgi:hypothetical protein
MKALFHLRFNDMLDELKYLYDVHDPDKDTVSSRHISPQA